MSKILHDDDADDDDRAITNTSTFSSKTAELARRRMQRSFFAICVFGPIQVVSYRSDFGLH